MITNEFREFAYIELNKPYCCSTSEPKVLYCQISQLAAAKMKANSKKRIFATGLVFTSLHLFFLEQNMTIHTRIKLSKFKLRLIRYK